MSSNQGPEPTSSTRSVITDLGTLGDQLSPRKPLPEDSRPSKRTWVLVALGGACVLAVMTSLPPVGAESTLREPDVSAEKPDVCEEVQRANAIDAGSASGEQGTAQAEMPLGYSFMGVWPEGSKRSIVYGAQYPDGTIEVCADESELEDLGMSSLLGPDEVGALPEGFSYAYEPLVTPQHTDLKLVGVRASDGSIQQEITLENGDVRPILSAELLPRT